MVDRTGYNFADWSCEDEETFVKALEKNPENAMIHHDYGLFLTITSNRYGEAEKHFKKALEIEPMNAELLWAYGFLLSKMGHERYPEAEEHLKKALKINPKDGPSWEILGWLYLLMEHLDDGVDCLITALNFRKQLPDKGEDILSELPILAEKLTDKFLSYISVFSSYEEKCTACFRLTILYKILGDEEKAVYWYREGDRYCKDFPEIKQKIDKVCKNK